MRVVDWGQTMNLWSSKIREMGGAKKLTELTGISWNTIYKWSCGAHYPRIAALVALSGALDCTMDELIVTKEDDSRKGVRNTYKGLY